MAKPRQSPVIVRAPIVQPPKPLRGEAQQFTDAVHVLARLNALEGEFQQIGMLSANLKNLITSLNPYRDRLAEAISKADDRSNLLEASHQELAHKSTELDANIAAAKAAADYVSALGEMVSDDHEEKWTETKKQWQQESAQLSQRLSDQVATHAGELQGVNQAWRAQVEATNQTWRKQIEAADQAWQLAQAQQAEQWCISLSNEIAQSTAAVAKQAHMVGERTEELANELTKAIAQLSELSERQSASQTELRRQMGADRAAWEASALAQATDNAALRLSIASTRKLLYGAGAAIAALTLLCIIALVR